MAIIVVGGSNRGVGRTALVCGLIAALPEYRCAAVRVTTQSHAPAAPSPGADTAETRVPQALRSSSFPSLPGFRQFMVRKPDARPPQASPASGLIREETILGGQTDTARYLAAGAARALVLSAREGEVGEALDGFWPLFGRGVNFIFESNSVVHHLSANACLLIHAVARRTLQLPERKPSFLAAVRHADAMVAEGDADRLIASGLCLPGPEAVPRQPPAEPMPIFHLAVLERISPELLAWLRPRLGPPPRL